ncbi:hypothetical protein DTO280E4_8081 [Paecilomyces variotii]|nr:hypothetical protein DTO169C6_1730 [Paecilomyces variotii]KAJ9351856.1 hypothetical protein DTO280E4_8081 [Paecilomyces variotii]
MGPPRRAPPRKGTSSNTNNKEGKQKQQKKQTPTTSRRANHQEGERQQQRRLGNEKEEEKIDLSITIPISLQQLLLNIFKAGLLRSSYDAGQENGREEKEEELDMKTLIQTIKSHLYNRDFDSAFTDANEELLRAYALRWSASRALGYAGIFRGVVGSGILEFKKKREVDDEGMSGGEVVVKRRRRRRDGHVLCIGGGAGAEIVALACVWRDLMDEEERGKLGRQGNGTEAEKDGGEGGGGGGDDDAQSISSAVGEMTLTKEDPGRSLQVEVSSIPNISITAVDIADWSSVVNRLSSTIRSSDIPGSKAHPAPLLPPQDDSHRGSLFSISFQKSDILTLSDAELRSILHKDNNSNTILVTLMFTLNELFSVSMAKTTAFLLRITDLLEPGTVLLVVDSPGSYSTVTLGKSKSSTTKPESESSSEPDKPQQRNYPMKFLLDHTLLSVAAGKWDKVLSQDSRWFRRDAAKLRYAVGEGAGLEDMRFQIHVYKRLET